MKILLVEDDGFKLQSLRSFILEGFPSALIDEAKSIHEAFQALKPAIYDFVLLDMSLPSHRAKEGAGGVYSHPVGGLDVLFHVCGKKRTEKVVIITQYPHIEFDQVYVPVEDFCQIANDNNLTNLAAAIRFETTGEWKNALLDTIMGAK